MADAPYKQSRAALRDRFGSRSIDAITKYADPSRNIGAVSGNRVSEALNWGQAFSSTKTGRTTSPWASNALLGLDPRKLTGAQGVLSDTLLGRASPESMTGGLLGGGTMGIMGGGTPEPMTGVWNQQANDLLRPAATGFRGNPVSYGTGIASAEGLRAYQTAGALADRGGNRSLGRIVDETGDVTADFAAGGRFSSQRTPAKSMFGFSDFGQRSDNSFTPSFLKQKRPAGRFGGYA